VRAAWKASHRVRMLDQSEGSVSIVHRAMAARKQMTAIEWRGRSGDPVDERERPRLELAQSILER